MPIDSILLESSQTTDEHGVVWLNETFGDLHGNIIATRSAPVSIE